MSKRLEILKGSLEKKENHFNDRLQNHFDTVRQTNGQPLNDKRNGHRTLNLWKKQDDALRTIDQGIELTKRAIEKEETKIRHCEYVKEGLPDIILELLEDGTLTQWRKHPETFFIKGVEKGRIVWDKKKKIVCHRYSAEVVDKEQRAIFAAVFKKISTITNA